MTHTFIACQSFAGGFDLGMTQAGWSMLHKVEMAGGFGLDNVLANRHLTGERWTTQVGDADTWEAMRADAVIGNPPCSGFSLLSHKDFRGPDSPINACMHAFADYVSAVRPEIAAFESVQQAYKIGLGLMRELRAKVERNTGERWDLYHVLHNAASVGGAAIRKRYFWLVTRGGLPFGVDEPHVLRVPSLHDVIGDLEGLGDTWMPQPYKRPASWWVDEHDLRTSDGVVDCHATQMDSAHGRRMSALLDGVRWAQGEGVSSASRRFYRRHRTLPGSWSDPDRIQKLIDKDWHMGFNSVFRWRAPLVSRVVTGAALGQALHPTEDRFFSHREVARIQGFPDDWTIASAPGRQRLGPTWGKGIPVQCGAWLGEWMRASLDGAPGEDQGVPGDEEREFIIDVTHSYRRVSDER